MRKATQQSTFPQPKPTNTIALFGEVLADVFPEKTVLGGAPYNVARHLLAFAQHPVLITRAGNDELRDRFMAELTALGMDDAGVQTDPVYPTGQVNVQMEGATHRFEIKTNQAYDHIHAGVAHLVTLATHPDLAYFGTLAQRNVESRLALDTFLSDAKCPRFLDMNLRAPWYDKHTIRRSLLRTEIVKLNEEELGIIAGMFDPKLTQARAQASFLMKRFDLSLLFITCGEAGAWALTNNGEEASVSGMALGDDFVDTVGAGDGFSAVCILGLLNQWPLDQILTRANQFATALCRVRGAAPANPSFYESFTEEWA